MDFVNNITGVVSIIITIGFGIFLTVKTRFFQFAGLKRALKRAGKDLFSKTTTENKVTSKGAMCTALAATIGTGNIVGVSGAIALCGAGVVFWICLSSILAMIIKYVEIYTVAEYRKKQNGQFVGGVMYAVKGLKKSYRPIGVIFAFLTVLASFGTGNLIQINTAVSSVKTVLPQSFGFFAETSVTLCCLSALFIGFLLLSGIGAVSKFCEKVIPFMLLFYVAASMYVIIINYGSLNGVLVMIFKGAFSPKSVTGGVVSSAFLVLKNGVVRGIVSNEAGMGSAAIAHAAASGNKSHEAELGIAEVFIDTLICVLTAFVILLGNKQIVYGKDTGLLSVSAALESAFGNVANIILCVFLVFFGLSSVLGWGTYGTVCAEFLWQKKGGVVYKIIFSAICVLGALVSTEKIWSISEILNSLVSIPNIIAVFLLFKKEKSLVLAKSFNKKTRGKSYARFKSVKFTNAV